MRKVNWSSYYKALSQNFSTNYFAEVARAEKPRVLSPDIYCSRVVDDTGNFIALVDKRVSILGASVKKQMAREIALPVHSINAPRSLQDIDFSDHRNYCAFGFDAAMITNAAFYRNKAYHTANDTYDRLSYDKMAEVVKGIYAVVMQSRR